MRRALSIVLAVAALGFAPSAQAVPIIFSANLLGANEDPPTPSLGTGFALVTFDADANTMRVQANFTGLLGTTTAAHIHCCTLVPLAGNVGVATMTPSFLGFPLGVTAGSMDQTFDLTLASTYNASFLAGAGGGTTAGAEAALLAGLHARTAYFNIHSTAHPGGEIRGFLIVPEPASLALLGTGLLGYGFLRRRKRARAS